MSEQAPRPEDTPAAAGPPGTGAAQEAPPFGDPSDPYEKRYNDLRSWTDRVTHETADLRREREDWQRERDLYQLAWTAEDEDTRRQAYEALGFTLEEEPSPSEPAEYDDPYAQLLARQEALEQRIAQRDQSEHEAQEVALIREISDERLKALAPDLDERSHNWLLAYAINALPALREVGVPVPVPDVKGALEEFQAWETERQKSWAESKRRAPYVTPGGQTATEVPTLDTHAQRTEYAVRKLQEAEQAE